MEAILGQPSRFVHCTRYTGLTDELSRLGGDINTKFLVVSSLTGILVGLTTGTSEVPKAIEKAMGSLGAVIKELARNNVGLRIFVAPCTPRNIAEFKDHANHALVRLRIRFNS
jgi:hypothetical protein